MNRLVKIVTLGVYGFDEERFFAALRQAEVDSFCDIRWRRGVRGRQYAFVNSRKLQDRLTQLGIRYWHFRDLAPSPALRARQAAADQFARIAKRQRAALSDAFVAGYREQCLGGFDPRQFIQRLGSDARVAALFCVERAPAACHRSLLAERLQRELGLEIVHLVPGSSEGIDLCAS